LKIPVKWIFSFPSVAAFSVVAYLLAWFFRDADRIPASLALWTGAAALTGLFSGGALLARKNFPGAAGLFLLSATVPLSLYSLFGSFSGEIRLGLGEPSAEFENIRKKALAAPPRLSIAFDGVKDGRAELKINGLDVLLAEGEKTRSAGLDIELEEMSFAPALSIRSGGASVAECLLKASRSGKDPPAVFDILPHKFTVRNIDRETIDLTVTRGKLKVVEKRMKNGESLEFEGFSMLFSSGERFVILKVCKPFHSRMFLALVSAALILSILGARRDG